MKLSSLTPNQIEYIFFHLKQHVEFSNDVDFIFYSVGEGIPLQENPKVCFPLSNEEPDFGYRVQFMDQNIPLLFPSELKKGLFEIDNSGNLVFFHDLLKAAFFILSGYQERLPFEPDSTGRFPYSQSIQKKLDITTIPVVNYYFEIIISGLEEFCKIHSRPFKRKRLFNSFGFFLSHDVDRVQFYHPRETAFKIKQLLGFAPLNYNKALTLKLFFKGILHFINPFKKSDPWWNFDFMINLEKKLGICSTFYFLEKIHRNMDSRYYFKTPKIKQLIKQLNDEGFEVGLHGAIATAESKEVLASQDQSFAQSTSIQPTGIRQHFLKLKYPETLQYQLNAGLKYDSSLGFAEHEGFRNGYCYPFHPYDHENDQMLDIWELPLMLMEVSVLGYKKEPYHAIETASFHLINEVKKFGGFYSLLWHNCRLDEYQYPGITSFYQHLLEKIMNLNAVAVNGMEILKKTES